MLHLLTKAKVVQEKCKELIDTYLRVQSGSGIIQTTSSTAGGLIQSPHGQAGQVNGF
jgi:hypothetical protein